MSARKAHPRAMPLVRTTDRQAGRDAGIPVGEWLVDVTPGHEGQPTLLMVKVVEVGSHTVMIVDEAGIRRVVSRIMLEGDLERGDLVLAKTYIKEAKR